MGGGFLFCECRSCSMKIWVVPSWCLLRDVGGSPCLGHTESVNSLVGTTLFYHYWETNVIFPIGGLVQPGKTLKYSAIRNCLHLVNFRIKQNERLYIAKVLDKFMDHEPVKITFFINYGVYSILKWRARRHTPALGGTVVDSINEVVVALEQFLGLIPSLDHHTSLTTEICEFLKKNLYLSLG